MEPFSIFGLQAYHLNICYYHQDLYWRPFHLRSLVDFCTASTLLLLVTIYICGPDGAAY